MDTDGLLRVGGRFTNADIPYAKNHQLIVPPKVHVTKLLTVHEHEKDFVRKLRVN
jgi:hypothetical protein